MRTWHATLLAGLALVVTCSQGADRLWIGGGTNAYWSNPLNWDTGVPQNNDVLLFPANLAKTCTNDLGALTISQLSFYGNGPGYVIRGNGINLTGGLGDSHTGSTNQLLLTITLATNNQTFTMAGVGPVSSLILGRINLNGHDLTLRVSSLAGDLTLAGGLAQTGDLTKIGVGTATIAAQNAFAFAGAMRVNAGTLVLDAPPGGLAFAIARGGLTIGLPGGPAATVRLMQSDQIDPAAHITVHRVGTLDLNGRSNTVAGVTFVDGGQIATAAGELRLNGDVAVTGSGLTPATMSGFLHLSDFSRGFAVSNIVAAGPDLVINAVIRGGFRTVPNPNNPLFPDYFYAGITKWYDGTLRLEANNSYGGVTTVSDGNLQLAHDHALGATDHLFDNGQAHTRIQGDGSIELAGVRIGPEPLIIDAPFITAASLNASGLSSWGGPITLNTNAGISTTGTLELYGRISGPGDLSLSGSTFLLAGDTANTYAGATRLGADALLSLNKTNGLAVPGDLSISGGTIRLLRGSQISSNSQVTIDGGLFDMAGLSNGLRSLTFIHGGSIEVGAGGLLSIYGDTVVNAAASQATINLGRVALGGAARSFTVDDGTADPDFIVASQIVDGGVIKNGAGTITLSSSNIYSGPTTISAGTLRIENPSALGTTNAGTTVASGATLIMSGNLQVGREALNLSDAILIAEQGSNTWAGPIALDGAATITVTALSDYLNLSGAITKVGATGRLTKLGNGTLILSGNAPNAYDDTTVLAGAVLLNKPQNVIAIPGTLNINSATVRLMTNSQIANTSAINISGSGLLDINGRSEQTGIISGGGSISLGAGSLTVGLDDGSANYFGRITALTGGGGQFIKAGSGTLALSGANTANMTAQAGTLRVNGSQPTTTISVNSVAVLEGGGTVNTINVFGGTLSPGNGTVDYTLNLDALVMNSSSRMALNLNGPGQFDQLILRSGNLANSVLNVSFGYPPAPGDNFRIIDVSGTLSLSGTFGGLPNGGTFTVGGIPLHISYTAGTGNDVVLSVTNLPLKESASFVLSGSVNANQCHQLLVVLTNQSANPLSNVVARLESTDNFAAITQPESSYPLIPAAGAATNVLPFLFYTRSNAVCGTNLAFSLTLTPSNANAFRLPLTLRTPVICTNGDGPCETCHGPFFGVLSTNDPSIDQFLFPLTPPSACGSPKPCTPPVTVGAGYRYDYYTFTNIGGSACVSVNLKLLYCRPNITSLACLGGFDPANICANYLGDIGPNPGINSQYSFDVPAHSTFVVAVLGEDTVLPCEAPSEYTLSVRGFECPERLEIRQAASDLVRLQWSTAEVGYRLLSAPTVSPAGAFSPVPGTASISQGKFIQYSGNTGMARFYKLSKP